MGDFQELAQVESTEPLCKWAYAAESIQRIPTLINIALRKAVAGRPGPVYLDLPAEMISGSVDDSEVPIPSTRTPSRQGHLLSLRRFRKLSTSSERPNARC